MSVFCRHPITLTLQSCAEIYPFVWFEIDVGKLIERLKSNGCIIIYNSNFMFCETIYRPYFVPVISQEEHGSGFVKKFHRNNISAADKFQKDYQWCIFKLCKLL